MRVKIFEMKDYKLGNIIENQKIDIHLALHQPETKSDQLKKSLKIRKELEIQLNDTQYQEEDTKGLFDN